MTRFDEIQSYSFLHTVPIQIRFSDLDILGHVNNASYHELFDTARVIFFRDVLGQDAFKKDNLAVIAQANTTFYKELFFTDSAFISTKVEKIGNKSFTLLQKLYRKNTNTAAEEITTWTDSVFVCLDSATHISKPIIEEWRTQLEQYM